jgi:hypothetical protein
MKLMSSNDTTPDPSTDAPAVKAALRVPMDIPSNMTEKGREMMAEAVCLLGDDVMVAKKLCKAVGQCDRTCVIAAARRSLSEDGR